MPRSRLRQRLRRGHELKGRAGDYVVGATIAVDGGIVYANPGIKGEGWD